MPISRRDFIAGAAGAAAAATLAGRAFGQNVPNAAGGRPNILLIESDDHLWHVLGCMGDPVAKTPNIDRLAARGVAFTNNVCQGTACMPSRTSLLTGSYPHNNGVYSNHGDFLHPLAWTFPAELQRAGYHTALIGKNHFKPRVKLRGRERLNYLNEEMLESWKTLGFDDVRAVSGKVMAYLKANCPYTKYLEEKGLLEVHRNDLEQNRKRGTPAYRTYAGPSPLKAEDSHDAFIRRLFTDWLDGYSDDKPFMAWVDFVGPHPPCDPPREFLDLYDPDKMPEAIPYKPEHLPEFLRAKAKGGSELFTPDIQKKVWAAYYAMVSLVDAQVGKMVEALEKKGVLDNTIVVFGGDQGTMLGNRGLWAKGQFFKDSANSPLVVSCPSRFRQGVTIDRPVEFQDIVPMFMEAAGVELEHEPWQGRSLTPLMTGKGEYLRDAAFCEEPYSRLIVTEDYRYVYNPEPKFRTLYDMKKDPNEIDNLAGAPEMKDVEQDLRNRVLSWLISTPRHANTWDRISALRPDKPQ